ncbi:MAG: hypothetical protein JO065_19380, partial [Acidobacteria bacterium]|nr:hypothetical protein [Acidobacteriota bacterium]
MRRSDTKSAVKVALLAVNILLLGATMSFAQQQINLTAGPTQVALPDGSVVPMWGYTCGTAVTGSTATCAALNPKASGWSPVVITVPTGQGLTINLTNNLSFTPAGSTTANTVPTSIVVIGQVGGGLGTSPTYVPSPVHNQQQATWPIANTGAVNNPPPQGPRVQSFATEVAAGATTSLTWAAPRPGTYLLESGTHPSIQVPMGLIGMLVVTSAPVVANPQANPPTTASVGTAYPGVTYDADVPLLFSEIDPNQNRAVSTAVNTVGFSETAVWSGQPGGCGNPSSATYNTCYPPAVNYSPLYFLINGTAFDKTNASASLFPATVPTTPASGSATGLILVRLVNAGLKMHVPSIVGSFTGGSTTTSGVSGFSILAEDGNLAPGVPKVQSDVFMAAGKTFDVMINGPAAGGTALPVYDRELSLSGNSSNRDAGMLAYISVNGAAPPSAPIIGKAQANADTYNSLVAGKTFTVSDPSKGVISNDVNVYGVQLDPAVKAANGTVTLNANGTFTYVPSGTATSDQFGYCANGAASGTAGLCTTVTLGGATVESSAGILMGNATFTSKMATYLNVPAPGVLKYDQDKAGYALSAVASSVTPSSTNASPLSVTMAPNGGFIASVSSPGTYSFTYTAQNAQGTVSSPATVTLIFPTPSNLAVTVLDGKDKVTKVTDYRWIIEEDKTFYINPNCTTNASAPGCPAPIAGGTVPTFGVNFHTSHMEFVAQGCTGPFSCESGQTVLGVASVCDVGNGVCRPGSQQVAVDPSQVSLDPTKRYYISVLPGDAANAFNTGNVSTGHGMGGAPIPPPASTTAAWAPVTVLSQPNPYQTGKLSVVVFEDDFPLNGEQDNGGGVDVISPNEPGLGGFNIILWDDMGGSGDVTGQMTYDMFNMPLTNSLAGQRDPATGLDACPISAQATSDPTQKGIVGMIVTCPKYESDGTTLSPLAGQAVVNNLMPGRFSVQAIPGADRIARGEEWLQTNTLDGQHAHDSFIRIGEPGYFQEYGPAGYHVAIGFANPAIINARHTDVCNGVYGTVGACNNTVTGKVTGVRMSRTPDERLYSSGSRDTFYWTQCFVSLGDPDAEDFQFTKCDADGK